MPSELQRQGCCFLAGYLQLDCNCPPTCLNSAVVGIIYVYKQYKETFTLMFCIAFGCWSSDTCFSNLSSLPCRSLSKDSATDFVWITCAWGNQMCTTYINTCAHTHVCVKLPSQGMPELWLPLVTSVSPLVTLFFCCSLNYLCFCYFPPLSSLPYFVHRMGCAQLLSSNLIFSFLLTAQCVAPSLIYCTIFKPCSDDKMVDFLMGISVSSSLYVYLWLHK